MDEHRSVEATPVPKRVASDEDKRAAYERLIAGRVFSLPDGLTSVGILSQMYGRD